jgi:hypothetical protein
LSLAAFVLICFFLPWAQLSCVGAKDSVSGLDLAREVNEFLWLVPAFMLAIILLGLGPLIRERIPAIFALAGTVGGSISAFLMYYERSRMNDSPRLIAMQWTVFYWLGFLASIGVVACTLVFYTLRSRSP